MPTPKISDVVDYEAWNKGYTPPSEHILIDQLAYRGARVVTMSDWGDDLGAIWIVVRGKELTPHMRKAMRLLLDSFMNEKLTAITDAAVRDGGQGDEVVRLNGDPSPEPKENS